MDLQKEIIDLLYQYECTNNCAGEKSWEKLVVGINKLFDEIAS